jgi:predicted amidohydrolase YtcJ
MPGGGWFPDQCISRQEALRGFHIRDTKTAFPEKISGTMKSGKFTDIVLLDKDILMCKPEEIPGAKGEMVIGGGKVKYKKECPKSTVKYSTNSDIFFVHSQRML